MQVSHWNIRYESIRRPQLLIGVLCWTVYMVDIDRMMPEGAVPSWFTSKIGHSSEGHLNREYMIEGQLLHTLAEIAQVLFFLICAMTIVELVDAHEGFALVTDRIRAKSKTKLHWTIGWLSFFLSAILDNLTTTIVMVSLLRKLVHDRPTRKLFVGLVIIAANAGGAWSVIGDVTTTMLWVSSTLTSCGTSARTRR